MADIIGGLNSLTSYLRSENEFQKKELEKEKQKISAQRIALGFKSMDPNHTENDARALVYDLINDANSLDSLGANLGLIDSLYKDTINNIRQAKIDKRDSIESEIQLHKLNTLGQTSFDQTNEEGQVIHRILNDKNEIVGKPIMKDARTDRQREELKSEFDNKRIASSQSSGHDKVVGYPGLTEGGLPMILTNDGLKVQQGGKLVMYDDAVHGTVNKGNSYNTGGYKDFKTKVDYYRKVSTSGYIGSESKAQDFINQLGLSGPQADPVTKAKKESNTGYLLRVANGRQGLWNKIDAKFPKGSPDHETAYKNFQFMMSSYESNQGALGEVQMAEAENKYKLGLDNFKTLNERMTSLLSIDTKEITPAISLEDAKRTDKVDEWIAFQLKRIILSKAGKKLPSDKAIVDYYLNLSADEKGQIMQETRNK